MITSFWLSFIIFAIVLIVSLLYFKGEIFKFEAKSLLHIVIIILGAGIIITGIAWFIRPFDASYFSPEIYDNMITNFLISGVLIFIGISSIKSLKLLK